MPDTHFAILRVQRVKSKSDLAGATRHGQRQDASTHFDPERTGFNCHWASGPVVGPVDWAEGVESAIERLGAVTRAGASVAAEFFVGASPDYFAPLEGENTCFNMFKVIEWANATMAAFYERYGAAVVAGRLDLDEATPHMAICILPVYLKKTKHTTQWVVSYRKLFGGAKPEARQNLTELQDWYAREMQPLGLCRGNPISVTRRGHLTHQQYAQKKQLEDQARRKALQDALAIRDKLHQQLNGIEAAARRQAVAEKFAMDSAHSAKQILEDAANIRAFHTKMAALLKAYEPNTQIVRVLGEKANALSMVENDAELLNKAIALIEQTYAPRPK